MPSPPGAWDLADSLPLMGGKHFACPLTHQKAKIHVSRAMGRFASLPPSVSPISLGWVAQPHSIYTHFSAAAPALALRAGCRNHLRSGKVLLQKETPPNPPPASLVSCRLPAKQMHRWELGNTPKNERKAPSSLSFAPPKHQHPRACRRWLEVLSL